MIPSFHKVGRDLTETRIYTFGKRPDGTPIRLPIAIPVMGLVWAFVSFIVLLIVGHALGVGGLPKHPKGGGAYGPLVLFHVVLPVAIAYVLAVAEVEGRRVHVLLRAWIAQGRVHHLAGGYQPSENPGKTFGYRRIRAGGKARRLPRPPSGRVYIVRRPHLRQGLRQLRHVAIPAAIAAIAVILVAVGLLAASGFHTNRVETRAASIGATKTVPIPRPPSDFVSTKTTRTPTKTQVARRFASAYLAYQIGQDTPTVRATLRAVCTPQFAALLIGSPTSSPPSQMHSLSYKPFHITTLSYRPPALVLARFANSQGAHGVLHIHVSSSAAGWQISGLS